MFAAIKKLFHRAAPPPAPPKARAFFFSWTATAPQECAHCSSAIDVNDEVLTYSIGPEPNLDEAEKCSSHCSRPCAEQAAILKTEGL